MTDRRRDSNRQGTAVRRRNYGGPDRADARPVRTAYAQDGNGAGPHLGPIPITATGVLLAIALLGSLAFLAFTITVRESTQIPMLAAGSVVLGIVFAAIAVVGGRATWRSSVGGRDVRAFGHALVGGIAALIAAACFSGAAILFLIKGG